jgi:hypothetical protein
VKSYDLLFDFLFYLPCGGEKSFRETCVKFAGLVNEDRILDLCRIDGFAIELGGMIPGMNAVAALVLDQDGRPIEYITVVGFFTKEHALKIGPLGAEVGNIISEETGNKIYWEKGFQQGNKNKTLSS